MVTEKDFNRQESEQTHTQVVAFVIVGIICFLFTVMFAASCFAGQSGKVSFIVDDRINPNHAPAASLVRLPNIGPSRAAAIIEYRRQKRNQSAAFKKPADLQEIKGIGPKTVESMGPWLCFE